MFALCDVYAEIFSDQHGSATSNAPAILPGVLAIVEKARGVFIEWRPCEHPDDSVEDWVIEEGTSPTVVEGVKRQVSGQASSALVFSADIKEVRSYIHNQAKKQQQQPQPAPEQKKSHCDTVKFICRDGTASNTLQFRSGGYPAFVDCLQRYAILNRSAKEDNLVLLADSREDALKKSLGVLMGPDKPTFVSRLLSNPYATSLTALSKLTSIV